MKLFMVEDNETIIKGLVYSFEKNGMEIEYRKTIDSAIDYIGTTRDFDFVILDIGLPDGNGIDFFREYIKPLEKPVIFLTAVDDEEIVVKALDLGAEDYMTKPFSSRELIARIKRIMIRNKKDADIVIDDIRFSPEKMICYKGDKEIVLSSMEIKIQGYLFLNINKTVNRNILLDKIWEWTGNYVDDHTVTVYMKRIRNKLGTDIIKTVKGVGYIIEKEEK